ncbi:MAG: molybdopterin molybdotransferase MoeA [Alphaproteobacteria bacterium]
MAQLSDDCFAFDGPLMPLDEALARLAETIRPSVGSETCPLDRAVGRFASASVTASRNVPPYANSAVDGYAVAFSGVNPDAETVLPVIGRVAAGHPLGRPVRPTEAARIFTGAPLPEGVDTVMMQEDCTVEGDTVRLRPGIKKGSNARDAGEDVSEGASILSPGQTLTPQSIGQLAAQGLTDIAVYKPLRVAVFSTGDEVAEPGQPAEPGQLYDSNRHMIMASLRAMNCSVIDHGIIRDDAAKIVGTIAALAHEADVIISTGGMSTGEEDHVRAAIETLGRVDFWRLAIKPGRPVGLGLIRDDERTVPLVGLPGNPVAAFTTFLVLARPLLLRLAGAADVDITRYRAIADFDYRKKQDRREFVRTAITGRDPASGLPVLAKHGKGGAGMLSSLVGATGFAELPEDLTELERGAVVDYLPL